MSGITFYYLHMIEGGDHITCYCFGSHRSEKDFLQALANSRSPDRLFLPVPESCVIRVYGRSGVPGCVYCKKWPLPWPNVKAQ